MEQAIIDGTTVKGICSGGDMIETRTNYKDAVCKRLQCTMVMNVNDFPKIEPPDAYQTLQVFSFPNAFVSNAEMLTRGNACPKHWRKEDPTIKTWCKTPSIIDAFTIMVLESYNSDKVSAPACVEKHTAQFKGDSAVRDIDRLAEIVKYELRLNSVVFVGEISLALGKIGLNISSGNIVTYIEKLYGDQTLPPVYKQFMKTGKRGYGFNHIKLNVVEEFDAVEERRTENLRKSEILKKQVRNAIDIDSDLGKRDWDEM